MATVGGVHEPANGNRPHSPLVHALPLAASRTSDKDHSASGADALEDARHAGRAVARDDADADGNEHKRQGRDH